MEERNAKLQLGLALVVVLAYYFLVAVYDAGYIRVPLVTTRYLNHYYYNHHRNGDPSSTPTTTTTTTMPTSSPISLPNTLNWFESLPRRQRQHSNHSIFSYQLLDPSAAAAAAPRSAFHLAHPQIAFIKVPKVGGTTIAVALDRVAREYGITTATKTRQGSLWFRHGKRDESWMPQSIAHVRYVALLREPIAQTLSWHVFTYSREYYLNYPSIECSAPLPRVDFDVLLPREELKSLLNTVSHCLATEFRANVTMQLIAHELGNSALEQIPVYHGLGWMTSKEISSESNATRVASELLHEYFIVAGSEHVNDMLVLLGTHMGWDLSKLYYSRCKPTDLDITPARFARAFPRVMADLEAYTNAAMRVYLEIKLAFERELAELYEEQPALLLAKREFESGLAAYQASQVRNPPGRWFKYKDVDGQEMLC